MVNRLFNLIRVGDEPSAPRSRLLELAHCLLALALLSGGFTYAFSQFDYQWNWRVLAEYQPLLWRGWWTTVALSLAALCLSVLIGMVVALALLSRLPVLRYLARIYVEMVRGTPLLVQILICFYVFANAVGIQDRYLVGIMTLSLFSGAYVTEIFRAGMESVGRSQWESARAIGLTPAQTYRYVVFPQALRQTLPPLAGQFVSLIKDSSLLSYISIRELTFAAQSVTSLTYSSLEVYLPLALGYLVLTLPISLWTQALERRVHFHT